MSANVANIRRTGTANFTTNSTSYVDLKDAAAGNTFAVTLTKQAGTDLLALFGGSMANFAGTNETVIVGVNDGATDWDITRMRLLQSGAVDVGFSGARLITGLASGSQTLKLRVKTLAGGINVLACNTAKTSYLTVIEVASPLNIKVNSLTNYVSSYTVSSTSYTNLLDGSGGTAISVVIVKASGAATNLLVRGTTGFIGGTATLTKAILGVNDGTTDWDIAAAGCINSVNSSLQGEALLTGLAAGTYTLTLRVKVAAQSITFTTNNHAASLVVEEIKA